MSLTRSFCLACWILFAMIGRATAEDQVTQSLVRQQTATIAGLESEITRLNEELDGTAGSREELRGGVPGLEKALAAQIARGDVWVVLESRGLVVGILDHALFDPDGTQFTSAGEVIMKEIAGVFSRDLPNYRVSVEGHTDNQPIENAEGITNWEYSIGRASAVLHYFTDVQDLMPQRFGVVGYSEYQPVASNDTEEGRDRNRRVEIVVLPQKVSLESEEDRRVL